MAELYSIKRLEILLLRFEHVLGGEDSPNYSWCINMYTLQLDSSTCLEEDAQVSTKRSFKNQGEREYWAFYNTSPQKFIRPFLYSLAHKLLGRK